MDAAVPDDSTNNVDPDEAGPTCRLAAESSPDTAREVYVVDVALTMFVPSQYTAVVLPAAIVTPVPNTVLNVMAALVVLLTKYNFVTDTEPLGGVGSIVTVPPPVPVNLMNMDRAGDVLAVPIAPSGSVNPTPRQVNEYRPEMACSMKYWKL